MVSYGMVIDTTRCTGCSVCVVACKDEYVGNDFPPYSRAQPNTQYGYYGPSAYPNGTPTAGVWVIPGQSWMKDSEIETGTYPNVKAQFVLMPCLMCANPPCQTAATNGAIYTRADGIVIIDPVKSVGQSQIVDACPYGRIYWNNDLNIPQKCTFCAQNIDAGKNPKCVDSCPMGAIIFGDLSVSTSAVAVAAKQATVLHPEYATTPKVTYIGLLSGTQIQ